MRSRFRPPGSYPGEGIMSESKPKSKQYQQTDENVRIDTEFEVQSSKHNRKRATEAICQQLHLGARRTRSNKQPHIPDWQELRAGTTDAGPRKPQSPKIQQKSKTKEANNGPAQRRGEGKKTQTKHQHQHLEGVRRLATTFRFYKDELEGSEDPHPPSESTKHSQNMRLKEVEITFLRSDFT